MQKLQTVQINTTVTGQAQATLSDMVIVGKVGGPFGVQGFLKILSYTDPDENILTYRPWYLKIRDQWQAVPVTEAKINGQQLIARFDNITDRDIARRYTNCEIGVERSLLPAAPQGEFYWNDLIGLKVIATDGKEIGLVTAMMETGSNDVLVVQREKNEIGIPFIMGDVIIEVDLNEKFVRVNWDDTVF